MIDFALIYASLHQLLHGALISLQISSIALFLGLTLGTLLACGDNLFIRAYVTLFRGTPMLVQILFVFYVLPQFGITIPPFWAASLAIGLNSAAYMSQIIKTGMQAISKGQIESAYTLGFTRLQTLRYIILPQAFQITLPAMGNEMITLIKDSSLASIIGVMELSKEASVIRSRTYDAFSILLAVAVFYLIMTTTVAYFLKRYEGRYEGKEQLDVKG